jgi:hypothetical protein
MPRTKRPSRAQREEVKEVMLASSAIEAARLASEHTSVGSAPHHTGRITVARGVVTAVCACGANETMSFEEFQSGWRRATEQGQDYQLMTQRAP